MKIKKILVPVDFSPITETILQVTKNFVEKQKEDVQIVLFHSIEKLPTDYNYLILIETLNDTIEDIKNQVKEKIVSIAKPYLESFEIIIGEGNPTSEIREVAKLKEVSMIILGEKSKSDISEFLLGSTAEKISRKCHLPTFIVKENSIVNFNKILIPIDFSVHSISMLKNTVEMFAGFDSEFIVLHVFEEPTFLYNGIVEINTMEVFHRFEEIEKEAESKLNKVIEEFKNKGINISFFLKKGTPFEIITEVAAEEKVDLISISSHGTSETFGILMGSTAHKVLKKSRKNILVIKPSV